MKEGGTKATLQKATKSWHFRANLGNLSALCVAMTNRRDRERERDKVQARWQQGPTNVKIQLELTIFARKANKNK